MIRQFAFTYNTVLRSVLGEGRVEAGFASLSKSLLWLRMADTPHRQLCAH